MTTTAPPGLAEFKSRTRAGWAAGDFPAIARRDLWPVGEWIVKRVGVGANETVLDVACGTGNAAIRAAAAGGRVSGVDLTPELFEAGRLEAEAAGASVEWVEGDAEALPFDDESFDVVLSTFGVMFAPRHQTAAAELARVLRPGGRLGLCNWTPEGLAGQMFRAMGSAMPAAPPFVEPPLSWGTEAHVRDLFAGTGVDLEFERDTVTGEPFPDGYAEFDYSAERFGPLMMLRGYLEQRGEWAALRERMAQVLDSGAPNEYLVVLGRKRGERVS